ncbi:MAG: efflux RND transporter periplasmic adaptor subunit [Bacteroidales bacterium]|nr:efflux RND transporter periplasmic adaptor subunit [Bacteroidales bacterium]
MQKIILFILMVLFASCNNTGNSNSDANNPDNRSKVKSRNRIHGDAASAESCRILVRGDSVFITESSPVCTKLKMQTVNPREYLVEFTTSGVVKPLSGHLAEISTPFEGRIERSFIKLGQKVNKGTPLFEVSSSDYLESLRMYLQALHERELADKNYRRKKDLYDSGVGSGKDYEEARLQFDLCDKELEKAAAILKIYNINPADADLGQPLIIRSPIRGEIVVDNLIVGQYLKSDSDPVTTIADLDNVWIVARVKEKDLGTIGPLDEVKIFTEGNPGEPVMGSVDYIGNMMNEQTRSVEVYIECENADHFLKSGMFVTVRFYHNLPEVMIIPGSSVLQDFDKSYLYVKEGPDLYIKREVTVTSIPDKKLIVNSGLEPGQTIVTEGAIYLH